MTERKRLEPVLPVGIVHFENTPTLCACKVIDGSFPMETAKVGIELETIQRF